MEPYASDQTSFIVKVIYLTSELDRPTGQPVAESCLLASTVSLSLLLCVCLSALAHHLVKILSRQRKEPRVFLSHLAGKLQSAFLQTLSMIGVVDGFPLSEFLRSRNRSEPRWNPIDGWAAYAVEAFLKILN
jgi:hypothetical protein